MSLPDVIALHGFARVGKDTVGKLLADRGYTRVSFAGPLYDLLYQANLLITVKNGDRIFTRELVDTVGWDDAKVLFPEVRQMVQNVGQAARNQIYRDVWADEANRRIQSLLASGRKVVVTDLRYLNEATLLQQSYTFRLLLVEVIRPGVGPVNDHISDRGLPRELFDWALVNDGTIEDLDHKIGRMLEVGPLLAAHRPAA